MLTLGLMFIYLANGSMFKPVVSEGPSPMREGAAAAFRPLSTNKAAPRGEMAETPAFRFEAVERVKPTIASKPGAADRSIKGFTSLQEQLDESGNETEESDELELSFLSPMQGEAIPAFVSLVEMDNAHLRAQLERAFKKRDDKPRHSDTAFQGLPTPAAQARLRRFSTDSDEDPELVGVGFSDDELEKVFRNMKVAAPVEKPILAETPSSVAEYEHTEKKPKGRFS